jgi:hypothetical protein
MEPGFIQVFRFYSWLRVASFLLFILPALYFHRFAIANPADFILPVVFTIANGFSLLGLLYWHWLEKKIGPYYITVALAFAAACLIVEQHLFSLQRIPWQEIPFLII